MSSSNKEIKLIENMNNVNIHQYSYNTGGDYNIHRAIEHFKIGDERSVENNTRIKDLRNIEKNINNSAVVSGMTKMLSSVITDVASDNKSDMVKLIAISNTINIGKAKGGDFEMSNIKQTIKIDETLNATVAQDIKAKIINDISKNISKKIENVAKNVMDTTNTENNTTVASSNYDAGETNDALTAILGASIGNSTSSVKNTDKTDELIKKFNLDASFSLSKNSDIADAISNVLNQENLANAVQKSGADQKINLDEIDVTGSIKLSNIDQESVVLSVMAVAFNQTIITDISTKIISQLDEDITNIINSISKNRSTVERSKTTGDVYAAGVAGKQVLEGVGAAAEGVGKGVGAASLGLMMPLIIAGGGGLLLIIIGVVGYIMYKNSQGGGDDE